MTTTVEAIYENGTLKLSSPLPLEEKTEEMQNLDLPLADWKAAGLNVPCGIKKV